eukprot:XP_014014109.1 PREDICTED: protein FAM117A-like isoform X2 [Salmo salar]
MSCRSGVSQTRGDTSGPQPLRATVPFQLHSKAQTSLKNEKKTKVRQVTPGMRRTLSLDAIVGPYLQGHWPKEPEGQAGLCRKNQSTQTPDSWSDEASNRKGSEGHKRSASWGSAEHLQEIAKLKHLLQQHFPKPGASGGNEKVRHHNYLQGSYSPGTIQPNPPTPLYKLTPRLRRSVEGLNQELEGMFVCQPPHHQCWILEVPDGHRAPVPPLSCSSGSQSDPSTMPLSPTPSPCSSFSSSSVEDLPVNQDPGVAEGAELCLLSPLSSQRGWEPSPLLLSSSPRPNKSYCFQREPPEGCEKVRVCEETSFPHLAQSSLLLSSCPDPNKVNFTPHGGSAFCPVSLLKPLLPSMDLLFRSLAVSPATGCSGQGADPYQAPSPGYLGSHPDSVTTAM